MSGYQGFTRRQFVIGAGAATVLAAAGAAAGAVGWRSWRVRDEWYKLTGAYGEPGAYPPHARVLYHYGVMRSYVLGRDVDYGIAWPPRAAARAVLPGCYCLPGRGVGPRGVLEGDLRLGDFAAQVQAQPGAKRFALVAVDGGDTYWHRRASGEDAMRMLIEEFIPYCEGRHGIFAGRRVIMGWSMGGYGALRAVELHPGRFCAVCAVSPALWRSYDAGVGDAFDSAADYAANDVYAGARRLTGPPGRPADLTMRIDCGEQDPFCDATKAFVDTVPFPTTGGFSPGGHNDAYWRRVAPAEMDFAHRAIYSTFGEG